MQQGIYEQIITTLVAQKLQDLGSDNFVINTTKIDKEEAARYLSQHGASVLHKALISIKGENALEMQITIVNNIIAVLKNDLNLNDLQNDVVLMGGELLKAIFSKIDAPFSDIHTYLKEITPYTRLTHSELFTGGNLGLSLESELRKEILSSDKIDFLVSFIKFKGIVILEKELIEFTKRGGELRVITTTYMGASDYKAIERLAQLPNTRVKISYNTGNERLHAKAYLFYRNTGFHTGYIGSSNFSRSALTDGLEWNMKITSKEVSHIIDKFQKTFESYWQSQEFELFDNSIHKEKLIKSLQSVQNDESKSLNFALFDINPYPFQHEILEKLEVERNIHNRYKNLIVAATGTGKTIISAFDFKRFRRDKPHSKFLFIAHRKEILEQAMTTFRVVLRDHNFGQLWVDGLTPSNYEQVFASVQTIHNRIHNLPFSPQYFEYVVIDECHHLPANSYRGLVDYFKPEILLGLTATPERMDGQDILEDFHNRIAAEIRLPEALNRKLLCPFQYFGVSDAIDLSNIGWVRGRYVPSELTKVYTANDRRIGDIINALERYTKDIRKVKALGFCVSIEHAKFMSDKFNYAGLKANYLTSDNSDDREQIRRSLKEDQVNYVFVVDIFNEGVDIPEIDTILFLRPTESLTIFLQQFGRGLRIHESKDILTVLDFVGNARSEYNFENKFRALIGKTETTVLKEMEDQFPHLPLGCSIVLEEKAKEVILLNIRNATLTSKDQIIKKIKSFGHDSNLPLTLKNFCSFYQIAPQRIYIRGGWRFLCSLAGVIDNFNTKYTKEVTQAILKRWLSNHSFSYFTFIQEIAKCNFNISIQELNEEQKIMATMLYFDLWRNANEFDSLEHAIRSLGENPVMVSEIIEIMEWLIDEIQVAEYAANLPYKQPLNIHARYSRDQILAAFGFSSYESKSSSREGVAYSVVLNTELLFINLIKSEENFSPTTMYDDYAINERLFHWQSQNTAGPDTPKGMSYINHEREGKRILLFVREKAEDEFGNRIGYVFIGEGRFKETYGSKPMSIIWELSHPLPPFLWKAAVKLQAG
jgi:superfamily II DNA or RNA helicase